MNRLISNVMDFEKLALSKVEYHFVENDINEVAREVCLSTGILSKRKGLDLRAELGEALPRIKFDKDKIVQVLMNLLGNAVNNTSSGSVTLSTQMEGNVVHVRVRDTGRGISAQDMQKLFIPFEKIEQLHEQEKGGTGLGLAISKEIVLGHCGKIWAESEPGKGSAFHFTLPVQERRRTA